MAKHHSLCGTPLDINNAQIVQLTLPRIGGSIKDGQIIKFYLMWMLPSIENYINDKDNQKGMAVNGFEATKEDIKNSSMYAF